MTAFCIVCITGWMCVWWDGVQADFDAPAVLATVTRSLESLTATLVTVDNPHYNALPREADLAWAADVVVDFRMRCVHG
jgi:hypothetical protein